jgi:hypothetical protein
MAVVFVYLLLSKDVRLFINTYVLTFVSSLMEKWVCSQRVGPRRCGLNVPLVACGVDRSLGDFEF